ncbi:hypothetical protein [Maritimibacter fusiformis]|nr:hypothetical protein [Maritimibacter fusiformis]
MQIEHDSANYRYGCPLQLWHRDSCAIPPATNTFAGTGMDMRNILLASAMATAGLIGSVQSASAQTFDLSAVQAACAAGAGGGLADPAACDAAIAAFLNGAALLPPTQRLAAVRQLQVFVIAELPPQAQTLAAVQRIDEEVQVAEQDASGI